MKRALIAVAAAAALLLAGCATAGGPSSTTPSPETSDLSTAITDIVAGDCYDEAGRGRVMTVPCDDPHAYEVIASIVLDSPDYEPDLIASTAVDRCRTAFEAFVGIEYDASELVLRTVVPSADTWAQGDREVLCVIADPAGRSTGSLEGALR